MNRVVVFGLVLAIAAAPFPALAAPKAACPVATVDRDAKRYTADLSRGDAAAEAKLDALLLCLADRNSAVRDDFALTTFSAAMRSKDFPELLVRRAHSRLLPVITEADDAVGVRKPFAAIALAEVARYDRLKPFLTPESRSALVTQAATYMRSITDYRGFAPGQGWRHGVAHGADLLMQLALNPAITPDDAGAMLDAIAVQVAPVGPHSYIHGESGRLARPVLFLAANGNVTGAQLSGFFARLKPDKGARWSTAYASLDGLAALHNSRAFAMTVLVDALRSKDNNVKRLEPMALDLLRSLP